MRGPQVTWGGLRILLMGKDCWIFPFASPEQTRTWVTAEAVDYSRPVLSLDFASSTLLLGILAPTLRFSWALIPNQLPEAGGPPAALQMAIR